MNKKIFLVVSVLSICLAVGSVVVQAYDQLGTHPALSIAAMEIYQKQASSTLTADQVKWIRQGSIDEDAHPRYTNHYYDPSTGNGLTDLSEVDDIFEPALTFYSARDWLWRQNSASGDFSVPGILDRYARGDSQNAYLGIGHILHLFQDMSVPAHTRNDTHRYGDPLEAWAIPNGAINLSKVKFQKINDLDAAFDQLARYSHDNFFSKDSIDISKLGKYKIVSDNNLGVNRKYVVKKIDGKDVKICQIDDQSTIFSCIIVFDDLKLHFDYWNMLYPKAVGYSAGVIAYFEKEFARIDKEKEKAKVKLTKEQKIVQVVNSLDANMMYGLSDIWSNAMQNLDIARVGWADMTQTINTQLSYFNEANKELAINMLNQSNILGAQVISSLRNPITAANLFKLQPADAQTIITYNPVASSTDGATGQVTVVMPGEKDKASQVWVFTIGSSTATTTPEATTTVPMVSIDSMPSPIDNYADADFIFSANETGVSFSCRFDATVWETCSDHTTYLNVAEGKHILEVVAENAAGNSSEPASYEWLVDLTAPTVEFEYLPENFSHSGFTIAWNGADPLPPTPPTGTATSSGIEVYGVYYQIANSGVPDDSAWQTLSQTTATSTIFDLPVAPGDIIFFRVIADDFAGNSAWSSIDSITITEVYQM
jgi:hypothetical protein